MHKLVEVVELAWFRSLRWGLSQTASDISQTAEQSSAMVIAPHPDDETLACGATIARKVRAGQRVWVVVVTDGRRSHAPPGTTPGQLAATRRDEAREACRRLGVPAGDLIFLDLEDMRIWPAREALAAQFRELLHGCRPDQVFSPSVHDRHPDHRVCALLMRDAAAACGYTELLEYPIWYWSWRWALAGEQPRSAWAWPRLAARTLLRPTLRAATLQVAAVRCEDLLDRKRWALEAYQSQIQQVAGQPALGTVAPGFLSHFLGARELFFRRRLRASISPAQPKSSVVAQPEGSEVAVCGR